MISARGLAPTSGDSPVHFDVDHPTSVTALRKLGKRDPLTVSSTLAGSQRSGVSNGAMCRTIILPTPLRPTVVWDLSVGLLFCFYC